MPVLACMVNEGMTSAVIYAIESLEDPTFSCFFSPLPSRSQIRTFFDNIRVADPKQFGLGTSPSFLPFHFQSAFYYPLRSAPAPPFPRPFLQGPVIPRRGWGIVSLPPSSFRVVCVDSHSGRLEQIKSVPRSTLLFFFCRCFLFFEHSASCLSS